MSSRAAVTDTRLLDELVLQHLKERGFAEVAASLEAELAKQKKPRGKAASALVADNTRPALVQLLISTMRLHESYEALRDWVDGSLEAFRPELRRLLFPMFVHCYLELVEASNLEEAAQFLSEGQEDHALFHQAELNLLSQVSAPSHVAAHEFAKRVRSRRFEVSLCAQSRSMLLHFLQAGQFTHLLTILNRHVTLHVSRLGLESADTSGVADAEARAAQGAASAAAQLWLGLGAEALRAANSKELAWGAPTVLLNKHEELGTALGITPPHRAHAKAAAPAADVDSAAQGAKRKRPAVGADADTADGTAAAEVVESKLPLPPLNEAVERAYLKESKKRLSLEGTTAPTAAMVTWVDAGGELCCAAMSNDCAIIGCGFSDGLVRLGVLRETAAAAAVGASKKKRAAAAKATAAGDGGAGNSASDPGGTADASGGWKQGAPQTQGEETTAEAAAEQTARELAVLRGHSGPVYGIAFSRDDLYFVSGSQDGTARLWGVLQRACLVVYHAHASPVWSVAFAPIGPYFATCGYDRSVRVWLVEEKQPVRILTGHLADVRCIAFHPNPTYIASGSDDASVRVWDVSTAKTVRLLCHEGHHAAVSCVAFSPDGMLLASGGEDKALLLWHMPSARLCRRFAHAHASGLWSVSFSQEGSQVATSSGDCSLAVWNCQDASLPSPSDADRGVASASATGGEALLTMRMHTKFTPVVAARYTRTNILLAVGAFHPPPASPASAPAAKRR